EAWPSRGTPENRPWGSGSAIPGRTRPREGHASNTLPRTPPRVQGCKDPSLLPVACPNAAVFGTALLAGAVVLCAAHTSRAAGGFLLREDRRHRREATIFQVAGVTAAATSGRSAWSCRPLPETVFGQ